jgi:hypothetical protein
MYRDSVLWKARSTANALVISNTFMTLVDHAPTYWSLTAKTSPAGLLSAACWIPCEPYASAIAQVDTE